MLTYEQAAEFILYVLVFTFIAMFIVSYGFYRMGYSDGREEGLKIRRHVERKVRRGEIRRLKV